MTEVRDATLGDAESILKIYDYYVKTTAITFEYDPPTLAEFEDRMEKIIGTHNTNQPKIKGYKHWTAKQNSRRKLWNTIIASVKW